MGLLGRMLDRMDPAHVERPKAPARVQHWLGRVMAAPVIRVEAGDMLDVLPRLAAEGVRVQAVVTDPPYHLTNRTYDGKWCISCRRCWVLADMKASFGLPTMRRRD